MQWCMKATENRQRCVFTLADSINNSPLLSIDKTPKSLNITIIKLTNTLKEYNKSEQKQWRYGTWRHFWSSLIKTQRLGDQRAMNEWPGV